MYKFYMPIGDWSYDGHGEMEKFLIASNKPVSDVREAHFKIKDVTGIDIESICCEYEDDCINGGVMERLEALGWEIKTGISEHRSPSPEDMARLWMLLLMKTNPELKLEMVDSEEYDMLPFYGTDDKGRHIDFVGYGLFD